MKYSIFIDGGAQSTKIYLKNDKNIQQLKTFKKISMSSFKEESFINIREIARYIKNEFPNESVLFGIPGYSVLNNAEIDFIKDMFINSKINIATDVELQIELNGLNDKLNPNYLYIAFGTGSIMYRHQKDESQLLSGWGHLLGDEGSAFDFGLKWIKKSITDWEFNKGNCVTKFTKITYEKFKLNNMEDIKLLYLNQNEWKQNIISFATSLLDSKDESINTQKEAIYKEMTLDVISYLKKVTNLQSFSIIYLAGGLFKSKQYLDIFSKFILNETSAIIKTI